MYKIQIQHWVRLLFVFLFLITIISLIAGVFYYELWIISIALLIGGIQYILLLPSGKRHLKLSMNPVIRGLSHLFPALRKFFVHPKLSDSQWNVLRLRANNQSVALVRDSLTDPLEPGYECLWNSNGKVPVSVSENEMTCKIGSSACEHPYQMNILNFALPKRFFAGLSIRALSESARIAGCAIKSTKDGLSPKLMNGGGDLIWQIVQGDPFFRKENRSFDAKQFKTYATRPYIKMIELKLPEKESSLASRLRGDSLLHFISKIRTLSGGKPIGVNFSDSNIVRLSEFCSSMVGAGIEVDFITIDESNPLNPHGLMPAIGFAKKTLLHANLNIPIVASGQFVTEFEIIKALAYGASTVYSSSPGHLFENGPLLFGKPNSLQAADFHRNTLDALRQLMENAGYETRQSIQLRDFYVRAERNEIYNLELIQEENHKNLKSYEN